MQRMQPPARLADYQRLTGDAAVMRWVSGQALTAAEAQAAYDRLAASQAVHPQCGYFYVRDPAGNLLGMCKLHWAGNGATEAEIGYVLLPEHWGRGLATQWVAALLHRAGRLSFLQRVVALTDPDNAASARVCC